MRHGPLVWKRQSSGTEKMLVGSNEPVVALTRTTIASNMARRFKSLGVLVTASGMVGRAVVGYCRLSDDLVFAYDHGNLDIGDLERVTQTVERDKPDVIINCAAWTDVDGCERDQARAFAANSYGPENLATAGHASDATLVTISTDYVFDGTKPGFYTQNDEPNPQSVYGKSKLEGEHRAIGANPRTVVVRTGFIFGPGGNNFLSTIVQRARSEPIKAISDAPGYTPDRRLQVQLANFLEYST